MSAIPFNRENSDFRLEMPTLRKTERGRMRHQNSSPDFTMAIVLPGPRHVNRMAVVPNSTLMPEPEVVMV